MLMKDGYDFEVLLNYDYLQRIARNRDYETLCEKITFDEDGFADPPSFSSNEIFEQIRKDFGLTTVVQPSVILRNKYSQEFFSQIPLFERDPFATMLVFQRSENEKGEIISTPIHDAHYLIINIERLATVSTNQGSQIRSQGVFGHI